MWTDKELSQATGLHANKAGAWWASTEERLIQLYLLFPGETAAALAILTAKALSRLEADRE